MQSQLRATRGERRLGLPSDPALWDTGLKPDTPIRHRVVAARPAAGGANLKGATTKQPFDGEPETLAHAVALHRFDRIGRAARIEAARTGENRRQECLIRTQGKENERLDWPGSQLPIRFLGSPPERTGREPIGSTQALGEQADYLRLKRGKIPGASGRLRVEDDVPTRWNFCAASPQYLTDAPFDSIPRHRSAPALGNSLDREAEARMRATVGKNKGDKVRRGQAASRAVNGAEVARAEQAHGPGPSQATGSRNFGISRRQVASVLLPDVGQTLFCPQGSASGRGNRASSSAGGHWVERFVWA